MPTTAVLLTCPTVVEWSPLVLTTPPLGAWSLTTIGAGGGDSVQRTGEAAAATGGMGTDALLKAIGNSLSKM